MVTELVDSYGYHLNDAMTDPFVLVNKAASETTSAATVPGTFLVDTFPLREYVHTSLLPSVHHIPKSNMFQSGCLGPDSRRRLVNGARYRKQW